VVWKLLLAKHMELRHIKAYKIQPFASKKNIARYRPYSNVDSFLKVNCLIIISSPFDKLSEQLLHFPYFQFIREYC